MHPNPVTAVCERKFTSGGTTLSGYNGSMDELSGVLSGDQVRQLARLLRVAMRAGHGAVVIRVERGHVRFVRVELEQVFDQVDAGRWDDIIA